MKCANGVLCVGQRVHLIGGSITRTRWPNGEALTKPYEIGTVLEFHQGNPRTGLVPSVHVQYPGDRDYWFDPPHLAIADQTARQSLMQ